MSKSASLAAQPPSLIEKRLWLFVVAGAISGVSVQRPGIGIRQITLGMDPALTRIPGRNHQRRVTNVNP